MSIKLLTHYWASSMPIVDETPGKVSMTEPQAALLLGYEKAGRIEFANSGTFTAMELSAILERLNVSAHREDAIDFFTAHLKRLLEIQEVYGAAVLVFSYTEE